MASTADKRKKDFQDQLSKAKELQERHREHWLAWDEVYHGRKKWPKEREDTLRSRLRVPWAWQQIETIIPRVMDADPKFEYRPVESSDYEYAEGLNTLVRWQLNEDRFVLKQRDWVEDGMVRAMAVAKVIWKRRTQTMTVRQSQLDIEKAEGKIKTKKVKQIVENRPTIVYVSPFDFLWDPAATNDTEWRYVFHRMWLTKDDLRQRQEDGVYKNVDKIDTEGIERQPRSLMEMQEEVSAKRGSDRLAVYERWATDGTVMVMCGDTVLRDDPNPYYHGQIPFVTFRTQPTPTSMVGVSEVEKIDHLQEAVWTRDNQRIDAVSLALNQVLILDPTIQGVRNITFKPGAKIFANGGQRVEQLQLNPLQIPAFNETEAYLGAMQQMTGANAIMYGSSLDQSGIDNTTATGVNAAREEGNMRMEIKRMMFRLFMAQIARLMVQLNHQYMTEQQITRIIGQDGKVQIPAPEEIPMFLDVIPEGLTESMSKMNERNSIMEWINIVKDLHGAPMNEGRMFTVEPSIAKAAKLWDQDPSDHFVPMPAPPPGMEQGDGPPTQ